MLGFAFGQPVLALLAMRQNRLLATIGAVQWLVLAGVLLMTQNKAPTLFYRNMVNCKSFPSTLRKKKLMSSCAVPCVPYWNELFERKRG